jgi:MoxR-like ATPase
MSATLNTLLGMPMGHIANAYTRLGLAPIPSKAQMARTVATAIDAGRMTLAEVKQSQPMSYPTPITATVNKPAPAAQAPTPANPAQVRLAAQVGATELEVTGLKVSMSTVAAEIQSMDQRIANLGQQQAGTNARLGQLGSDVASLHARVENAANAAQAETKSLRAQVQTLADSLGTMPVEEIRAAMRQAVADAWGPVRAAAEANSTEADVRAQVAGPAGRASAMDVFGVDARDARGRPHIWTEPVLRMLALAEATGRNAWLAGPAGVGKSQTVQQYAARTGRAFERFQMHKLAGVDDFLGAVGIKGGDTVFQPGPILRAFTTPGTICLIDEPATGSPAVMAVLNGLLEPGQPRISHGEKVYTRALGTLFFGADNSNGQGDTGGRFAGVQTMNTATMDRFSFVVPLTYLDPSDEAAALVLHTGCTQRMADHVIQAFTLARAKVETGDLIDPPTFRQAIAFTQACSVLPPSEAWRVTIAARQPMESQVALAAIYSTAIDETIIAQEAA